MADFSINNYARSVVVNLINKQAGLKLLTNLSLVKTISPKYFNHQF